MVSHIFPFGAALVLAQMSSVPAQGVARPPPSVLISSVAVTEGDAGMTMFTVHVSLAPGAPQTPIQLDITAVPMSATPGEDYLFTPVNVTIEPGAGQDVTGFVIGDSIYEGDETFLLQGTATPGSPGFFLPQNATVTIADDDLAKAPHVSAVGLSAPEGNAGWHVVEAQVRLAPAATSSVSVAYALASGTPFSTLVPWGDYRPAAGTLTFFPGETSKTVPIEVNGDTAWEPDAHFNLQLTNARGAVIDAVSSDIALTNDDAPTVVTIADAQVTEGDTVKRIVSVHVGFDPPAPPQATVRVAVVGGTARAGEDFEGQSLVLHPPPGGTSMTFGITALSDMTPECDEGVVIEYQGLATGDETKKQAKLLIVDDDGGPKDAGACPDPFATRSQPLVTDAGADGGTDASADAGPSPLDTAPAGDGASERITPTSSGGCAVAPPRSTLPAVILLVGATFAASRRKRRA